LHNESKPPEHKTRLMKKHKPKPVQSLTEHCIHILVILGEDGKGKGKNELYRQLGTLNGKYLNYDINEVKRQIYSLWLCLHFCFIFLLIIYPPNKELNSS
jgi:hypothetical protein